MTRKSSNPGGKDAKNPPIDATNDPVPVEFRGYYWLSEYLEDPTVVERVGTLTHLLLPNHPWRP